MCGGTCIAAHVDGAVEGLSPRVRGNRDYALIRTFVIGSIPACAGEPNSGPQLPNWPRVYPRVCGGTCLMSSNTLIAAGLSPRVRGNPVGQRHRAACKGSIPACAGEPESSVIFVKSSRVYPRVCGGTARRRAFHEQQQGLSPRVRGNLRLGDSNPRAIGSIPACAGEPPGSGRHRNKPRVYPRVCGGTSEETWYTAEEAGLSPRVRGNLQVTAGCPV